MELGWDLPKRRALIDELLRTETALKHWEIFQGKRQPFSIYIVPLALPKYRLANGRTQAAQENFLSKNSEDYSVTFFEDDDELKKAQEIQHELLKGFLGKGDEDLIKFFKDNEQTAPLILTHTGFIVNGNRRACAMRCLLAENENKYQSFQNVEVIILPPCEEKDIDELEARLQIIKDIKADYTWISEACMLRHRHIKHDYSIPRLSTIYGKTENDILDSLDTLLHVDTYLDSRGKSKQYELVEKQEYAFKQLKKARKKIKDVAKKEVFTSVAYILFENPNESGRLYSSIPGVEENLDKVIENLKEELCIADDEGKKSELFTLLDDEEDSLESLIVLLKNTDNNTKIVDIVDDVIAGVKEKEREVKNKKYSLNQISKANTLLQEAITGFNNETDTNGIQAQLNEIEKSIKRLRELS